jgi:hypothetical protein
LSIEKSILLSPASKFFGNASVVSIADRLDSTPDTSIAEHSLLDRDRRACGDSLRSTPLVEQPHEPPAGRIDIFRNVLPAGGPPAEDVISLGCSAPLGVTFSIIYRITPFRLISCTARHFHPSISALTAFLPLRRLSIATGDLSGGGLAVPSDFPMPLGIMDLKISPPLRAQGIRYP